MDHRLRIYLLDRPDISGVLRSQELVSSAFSPAVETPFVISHEILPRENGMLLDPDYGLREVQTRGLKHRRIVADVGIASPDIESASWFEHASQVAKPGVQQTIEFLV